MSCPDQESLSAFADCELEVAEIAAIESHLAVCAACREFVNEMRRLDNYGRASLRAISVPASEKATLSAKTQISLTPPVALAAVAVILLGFGTWVLTHRLKEAAREAAKARPATAEGESIRSRQFNPPSDEAFERWAAPFRRLHVPLLPMEKLADYKAAEIPFATPPPRTGDKKS